MGFLIWSAIILVAMIICTILLRAFALDSWTSDTISLPKSKWLTLPIAVGIPALIVVYLANAIYVVPPGHVGFPVWFGNVQEQALGEGVKVINPMANLVIMDGRRYAYEFTSDNDTALISVSKKQNPLTVEAAFPFKINEAMAWKVYQKIGIDGRYRNQLRSAARAAVRSAVAEYEWGEVTGNLDRISVTMRDYFARNITRDLVKLGFSEEEADMTFTFMDVQLRKIVPDDKILNATAEKMAALQDLQRQKTLTDIADEVANRRAKEGKGVARLFAELPDGFEPSEISEVLGALADKQRADALLKAVEVDGVKIIVMDSGSGARPAINVD